MEKNIEVRYAGVVIGQVARVGDVNAQGLFLGMSDPMPVGSTVTFRVDGDAVEGRVEQVSESTEPARCGMRIRFDDPSAASLFGIEGGPARVPVQSRPVTAPVAPARVAAPAPVPVADPAAAPSAPEPVAAAATDGGDDASAAETAPEGSVSEGDHGAAPDSSASPDDSGGQPGGGGGRRRRRRR